MIIANLKDSEDFNDDVDAIAQVSFIKSFSKISGIKDEDDIQGILWPKYNRAIFNAIKNIKTI